MADEEWTEEHEHAAIVLAGMIDLFGPRILRRALRIVVDKTKQRERTEEKNDARDDQDRQ